MARDISARALECIKTGPSIATKVTVTKPGGDPIEVETNMDWSVQESGPIAGTRLQIQSLQFLPTVGVDDLFELVSWPRATVNASIGISLGGASFEYVPVFSGHVIDGTSKRNPLGVTATLADPWAYDDRIPFTDPLVTTTDTRAQLIAALFAMVHPSLSVLITADGGTVTQSGVYTGTRGAGATQLATDGKLQAGFTGNGDLVVKAQPDLDALTPVWTFRSGTHGPYPEGTLPTDYPTIVADSLERMRPLADLLVNAVAVVPANEWQTWTAQTARLTDTSDPRHESVAGLMPAPEIISSTIDNACDALELAENELNRMLRGSAERVRVTVVINPAVEADDVFYLAAMPTADDPKGWNGAYIATSVTHSPKAGTTTIEGVSAAAYSIGQ